MKAGISKKASTSHTSPKHVQCSMLHLLSAPWICPWQVQAVLRLLCSGRQPFWPECQKCNAYLWRYWDASKQETLMGRNKSYIWSGILGAIQFLWALPVPHGLVLESSGSCTGAKGNWEASTMPIAFHQLPTPERLRDSPLTAWLENQAHLNSKTVQHTGLGLLPLVMC